METVRVFLYSTPTPGASPPFLSLPASGFAPEQPTGPKGTPAEEMAKVKQEEMMNRYTPFSSYGAFASGVPVICVLLLKHVEVGGD